MSCNDKGDSISKEEWQSRLETFPFKQDDINKLIMNYLVTAKFFEKLFVPEGFKEAAEKFQAESGVEPSVDLSSLDNRILIREAVQNGRIKEATHLVNQLHPELLDNDRYLYFHLQQLHLIELIRAGKIEDALTFAQTQISEAGESNPEVLNELERTLALLAFEKPQNSPFADLLDQTHRQKVASELNAAILKMEHQEQSSPRMINVLKLILWAQAELDKKNVKYPKMVDLATATIDPK
ncbi:glucose-induced degradation protein 8 homolog isoform X1 [Toxorhynchites rutilus septentrionalis]|uniref:glucose-induced degradation protein 8 homolog isoform X1 n=1 Tax=Toxorhynchites rutilus septentrionalis TaxID=329112 RepID=UPI00247A1CCA|nr:glucose-induced degradation protein 8 homolog isoform X1 [Toxorhynchites rutilus septentrionalis]